ncbi:OmpG family monomeric porin [Providencia alcalifaciens]|uniref:OmpG family monomeric porin n=1 Tax=Providencia alcalifaciens TaxID=126385 RepID=UPI0012BD66F3
MNMKSITSLILSTAIIFPTISYSQSTEDHWRVKTNVYLELEEYQGQRDSQNNKVYDKASMIGKLSLTNPTSTWSFDLEHRESLRNHGKNFSNSRDSYIRNRTQIGATKQFIKDKISNLDINFTYRKESNDGTPGTQSRSSNSLYWLMPSGSIYLDSRWTFDFWGAFYYYSNFYEANSYEFESEVGVSYKLTDDIKARLSYYSDKAWDNEFTTQSLQRQIRLGLPVTINQNWSISPYFRYLIADIEYNNKGYTTQQLRSGYRIGTQVEYKVTPKLALWAGAAYEPTNWKYPKGNEKTSGNSNKQTMYLGQLGVKYSW